MNFLEQVIPKTCDKQTNSCSNICAFYKICISDLIKTDKVTFLDLYIKYHNNPNSKISKTIKEYKQIHYSNDKNLFFEDLISYFKEAFLNLDDFIPETIIELLLKNNDFRIFVSNYVKENNPKLIDNSSVEYFEELSFLLYLSWMNKSYDISKDIVFDTPLLTNEISTDSIIGLLNYYNDLCTYLFKRWNYDDFNKNIPVVINLLDIINNAILIGDMLFWENIEISEFLFRNKQKIGKFIEISANIENNEGISNQLNYSYSKIDLVFSHLVAREEVKNTKQLDKDFLLDKYNLAIKKQVLAYQNLKNTDNWNEENIYKVFFGNVSVSILDLLDSFEEFNNENLFSEAIFLEILDVYKKEIKVSEISFNNLLDLKKDLIDNITSIYLSESKEKNNLKKESKDIIEDFIKSNEVNQYKIEALYYLVRSWNPDKGLLMDLGKHLISSNFTSYYHEDFKIKILTLIVKSFTWEKNLEFESFLNDLEKYIVENKIATHLINSYSHIYLYISLYYSYLINDSNTKDITKLFYYKFTKMRTFNSLNENKILKSTELIAYNIWFSSLKKLWISDKLNNEDIIKIWRNYLRESEIEYYNSIKNDINSKITNLIKENIAFKIKEIDLLKELLNILSSDIFHWFCDISIIENWSISDIKLKKWYDKEIVHLHNEYELCFIYPLVYKRIFQKIYFDQRNYVVDNVKNLIDINIQKRSIEIEPITGFYNDSKIKNISAKNEEDEYSIMILRISNLLYIEWWYWHEAWAEYIKAISIKLKEILRDLAIEFYKWNRSTFTIHLKNWLEREEIERAFEKIDEMKVNIDAIGTFHIPVKQKSWIVLNEKWDFYTKWHIAHTNFSQDNRTSHSYYEEWLVDPARYRKNIEMLSKVNSAIEESRIVAFLQAIIDLKTWEIYKYESLVRIIEEDGNIIQPGQFIPILDELEETWNVTKIMLHNAFESVKNRNISVSVNISGVDLINKDFMPLIKSKISQWNFNTSNLTLEILESRIMWDYKNVLVELKEMWFKIAIDDFWAEWSNIDRVFEFSGELLVDYVKLDGKIIKPLPTWQWVNTIKGITADCHKAWIKVIAEYVENEEILKILNLIWVDFGQWYHFSKPLHPDEI